MLETKVLYKKLSISIGLICLFAILPIITKSPATFLRQVLIPKNGRILSALFTPKDNIRRMIVELINKEETAIYLAVYYLTDPQIASALSNASRRGVKVSIITEASHIENCPATKIFSLQATGIPIRIIQCPKKSGIMHHKFWVFEKNLNGRQLLVTGSYNPTERAQDGNYENVVVADESGLVADYLKHYQELHAIAKPLREFLFAERTNTNFAIPAI